MPGPSEQRETTQELIRTPGVLQIPISLSHDNRGSFGKWIDRHALTLLPTGQQIREIYYSHSVGRTIRGMHLQLPPHEHGKFVTCVRGVVRDVVVDLRIGSPSFGIAEEFRLDAEAPTWIYIPPGVAHGFLNIGPVATLLYAVSSDHAPDFDTGVRWNSFGFDWKIGEPIISARDASLPALSQFCSPFKYLPTS